MSAVVARFAEVTDGYDESLLTGAERTRRHRLRQAADRAAFTAAHVLARQCAAELCGAPVSEVAIVQECPGCGAAGHGRPSVAGRPDVHLSLSHSRRHVAAIAAWEPCGIDIEDRRPVDPVWRALTEPERAWVSDQPDPGEAFLRLWVRKEALVKAGAANLGDLATLDVLTPGAPGDGPAMADWSSPDALAAYTPAH